jgi:hypothetical protein
MLTPADLGKLGQDILKNAITLIRSENSTPAMAVNVYMGSEVVPAKATMNVAGKERTLPIPTDAVHLYADLAPLANWAHPVRHLFYHPKSGELMHSEYNHFPPQRFGIDPNAFLPMHVPLVFTEPPAPSSKPVFGRRFFLQSSQTNEIRQTLTNVTGNKYAILFSGNSNNRHLNDLEFLYRVLVGDYRYDPGKITVLNYDGTLNYSGSPQPVANWPGDGTPYRLSGNVNGPGTQAGFDASLTSLQSKLQPNDSLLIHTNNHGGQDDGYNEPWLCGYPNFALVYTASVFGQRLKTLPQFQSLIVSMEQCFSGGFMSPVLSNSTAQITSFASAVPANMSSIGGFSFDPWASDWISAFHGANPDGSGLKVPVQVNPSTKQAFDYSNSVHAVGDSPQFNDKPVGSGATQYT